MNLKKIKDDCYVYALTIDSDHDPMSYAYSPKEVISPKSYRTVREAREAGKQAVEQYDANYEISHQLVSDLSILKYTPNHPTHTYEIVESVNI